MLERAGRSVQDHLVSQRGFAGRVRFFAIETGLAAIAGVVTAVFSVWLFTRLDFEVMCRSLDLWFDSDPIRIVAALTSRFDQMHFRSSIHPLWSIGVATPFLALVKLVGVKAMVTTYVGFSAAAFGATIFAALRMLRLGRLDSYLLLGLCLSTSSAWLWLGIAEIFPLGAVSMVIPMIWLAAPRGGHDRWSAPLQSLVSLAITITNWVAGLLAAFLALGLRGAAQTGMIAFTAAGLITVVQYRFFPQSGAYFNIWTEETVYGTTGTFLQHARTFFLSTIAAPAPDLMDVAKGIQPGDRLSRLQFAPPTFSPVGLAALGLWAVLALRGLWAAANGAVSLQIASFVLGMILFNFALHAVYGIETFLYSLHFLPFFTFVAAWSLLPARGRTIMRAAIAAAIVFGMIHNFALFELMAGWHNAIPPELVADPRAVESCR